MFTVINEIWCALHYTSLVGVCNSFSILLENRDKLVWSFPSMLWHWMSHGNHREYSLVPLLCPTPGRSCRPTPREMCSCPVTGTKVILKRCSIHWMLLHNICAYNDLKIEATASWVSLPCLEWWPQPSLRHRLPLWRQEKVQRPVQMGTDLAIPTPWMITISTVVIHCLTCKFILCKYMEIAYVQLSFISEIWYFSIMIIMYIKALTFM